MAGEDLRVTVGADIAGYQAAMQQAGQVTQQFSNDASKSLANAAMSTDQLGGAAQSASMRFYTMRSGVSAARDGVMAFTLGGQAAERSLMAMGHHITSLVNETGSFKGAMGALASSLWGPGGIILGLTLAMELFSKFRDSQKKAAETQDEFTKALNDGVQSSANELSHMMILYQATQNENLSRKERLQAVRDLQKEYPAYFGNLSQEAILAGKAAGAYNALTQSIINTAVVKAGQESLSAALKPLIELQASLQAEQFKLDQGYESRKIKKTKSVDDGSGFRTITPGNEVRPVAKTLGIQDENGDIQQLDDYRKGIQDKIKSNASAIQGLLEQYGVGALIKKEADKPQKTVTGLELLLKQQKELKTELDNAAADGKPQAFLTELAKKYEELGDKIDEIEKKVANSFTFGGGKAPLEAKGMDMTAPSLAENNVQSQDKLSTDTTPINEQTEAMKKGVQAFQDYYAWLFKSKDAQKQFKQDTKEENLAVKELTKSIGDGLVHAFESAMNGTQSFVQSMAQFLEHLIEKLIAAAAAAAILSVLLDATGLGALMGLSAASTSFSGMFGSLSGLSGVIGSIPQHAQGGIATQASLGIFGEAGPEALIPLNRMHEFTGGGQGNNFTVEHRVSGSDLLLVINRATKTQGRKS